jgi:uncharacterized protein
MKIKGRIISKGLAEGNALITNQEISFYGGVDPETGKVIEKDHELEGQTIAGKILVFPQGKGSTVGSYTLYRLKKNNLAPIAILNRNCETIVAVGAIISEIPLIDKFESDIFKILRSGDIITVNANEGWVEVPK